MQQTDTNTMVLPPVSGDLVRIDGRKEKYVGIMLSRVETEDTSPDLLRVRISEDVVTIPPEYRLLEVVQLGRLAPKKLFRQFGCEKYEVLGE